MIESPLEIELSVLKHYSELLNVLYGANLNVMIEIEPDVDVSTITTVAMGLQLMVENAVRHNEISAQHPISIHVFINSNEAMISNPLHQKRSTVESTRWSHQYIRHICNRHGKLFTAGVVDNVTYRVILPHLKTVKI